MYGEEDEVCFTFSSSRSQQHLHEVLGEFKGTLLSDGYSAYDSYVKKCKEATLREGKTGYSRGQKWGPSTLASFKA
jgi:hypothetical protein